MNPPIPNPWGLTKDRLLEYKFVTVVGENEVMIM
jgi:hypothetical protein